ISSQVNFPPRLILNGMLAAAFNIVLSDALLAEYRRVLLRPPLRKAHSLAPEEIDEILVKLARNAIVMNPAPGETAPEKGDQHLWDLLSSREDLFLVTGDKLLQRDKLMRSRIVSPATFVEHWLS